MSRSHERQTIRGGSVSCGRNLRRAIRKEPAESRLQPGLTAPQSRRVSGKRESIPSGTSLAGETDGRIGGEKPAKSRLAQARRPVLHSVRTTCSGRLRFLRVTDGGDVRCRADPSERKSCMRFADDTGKLRL